MPNRLAPLLVATLLLAACSEGAASTPTPELASGEPCPVTIPPDPGFTPPAGWMPDPRPDYDAVWYGDERLWTMLDPAGEVWTAWDDGHLPLKHFWFSTAFNPTDEPEPALATTLRRLDGTEMIDVPGGGAGTRPRGELYEFMIGGGALTPGCWEITATYRGVSLGFVAELQPAP